jgi:propionyl-CoA carboxylase alpha chain
VRNGSGGFLKYIVDVNGRRLTVDLGADGIFVDGERASAHFEEIEGTPIILLNVNGTLHRLAVQRGEGRGQYSIWTDGHRFEVDALDERRRAINDMSGAAAASIGPAPLIAPMPGLVVRINVAPGEQVQPGQPLVVMEAMKMENELRSSSAGVVAAIRVQPGAAVEKGAVLIELRAE